MAGIWYYVDGRERVGPVEISEIESLFSNGKLTSESYVWRKGFGDWVALKDAEELAHILSPAPTEKIEDEVTAEINVEDLPPQIPWEERKEFNWHELDEDAKVITIKIGLDRGTEEVEYGPYSISQLRVAVTENRINEKTFIFAPGMPSWRFLGETPLFGILGREDEVELTEEDRRMNVRKPFVARMLFSDESSVHEGICRDISVGGMQILLADTPCKVGDSINLNVHPENSEHCFVAKGSIVRLLDGNQGFSMRFEQLEGNALSAINAYLDE